MIELSKLKTIEDCHGRLKKFLGSDEIVQLAKDGICPHYVMTNPITKEQSFFFVPSELNEWMAANYIHAVEGKFVPEITFMDFSPIKPETIIPLELIAIRDLFELPMSRITTPPGVYFLCQDGKIMYIGQSVNVASRIVSHVKEKAKKFNSVFFIPCPINRLDDLEGALIRKYKPELNGNAPVGARGTELEDRILNSLEKTQINFEKPG